MEVETEVVEENLIEATNNNTGVPVMEAPVDEIPKNIEDTTENILTEIVSTDTVSTEMETEQIVEVKENIEVNTEIEVTIDEN